MKPDRISGIFIALWILFFMGYANGQEKNFGNPLDIPLLLSGSFGELRHNHFHAGLDLKTQGKEGLNVFAIEEGYISRIKVGLYGYGKVLYITHPNGYTSVYAHLQKFSPKIEQAVKQQQYAQKSYEVELFPSTNEFLIKKGEIIALSGNTGSSGGPHLHFEIRDADEKPLNPLLFGYKVSDHQSPDVFRLVGYTLSKNGQIDGSQLPRQINFSLQPDGTYLADAITAEGNIGFGVETIDRQDFAYNKNGAYKVMLQVNGTTYMEYSFDQLAFPETRYINTLIDYPMFVEQKSRVQRLFKTQGNRLTTIYGIVKNNGIIPIENGFSYTVTVIVKDFEGNETRINIPVEGKMQSVTEPQTHPEGKLLVAKRDQYYTFDKGNVYFPENTFYDDFMIQIQRKNDTVSIHNSTVPAHRYYNLTLENTKFKKDELSQVFIAYINYKDKPMYENTIRKGETFTTRTRNMGDFLLMKDSIPPTLRPINFKEGATVSDDNLKVLIADDLSGVETYTATLNGKWILFEYEPKLDTLTFDFNDLGTKNKENNLVITAKDNAGNEQMLQVKFFRK